MNDYEFILFDRIEKIKQINDSYNLLDNSYISFSGGKDSTILHYLIDLALPNNNIPRVFINTGIEYNDLLNYVKELSMHDNRIIIINSKKNIKNILTKYGYPFKSKQHSQMVEVFQNNKENQEHMKSVKRYLGLIKKSTTLYKCPNILKYQFNSNFNIKISDKCCEKLKKEVARNFEKENNKYICLTGMRKEEKGQRATINCIITDKKNNLKKFHPLLFINDDFENEFLKRNNIKLCKLYYAPYNFKRTGCKGCPFNIDLNIQLEKMRLYLPNEYLQCYSIWEPIYNEYIRLDYRLKKQMFLLLE